MADDRVTKMLDIARWRFAWLSVHTTKTAKIVSLAGVDTFFRTLPTKEALLHATFKHASQQLTVPLQVGQGAAQYYQNLPQLLARWWQLTTRAALATPSV
jgi:hypothetical protein